jgi:GAF domain-containing protein
VSSEQPWAQDQDRPVASTPVDGSKPDADLTGAHAGQLAAQFVLLTRALLDSGSVAEVLERVVFTARDVIPGADVVSVTIRSPDGQFHTPVQTDAVAVELDRLQYELGEGCCLEAARPTGPAMAYSEDLASDARWPRFGPAAAQLGLHSVSAAALVPEAMRPRLSGALNVYCRQPRGLRREDHDVLLLLATHASLALATTEAVTRGQLLEDQLRQALDSRDAIGQAKGILMARRGVSAEEAFDILRRTSQDLNIRLRDLAATLAERHMELDLHAPD